MYTGILFGVNCITPHLVPVPLDYGCEPYTSVDDLVVDKWFPRDRLQAVAGMRHLYAERKTVHCPSLGVRLVIFHEGGNDQVPANDLLVVRATASSARYTWRGNVVVVMIGDLGVVDVRERDVAAIQSQVERCATVFVPQEESAHTYEQLPGYLHARGLKVRG